jgi:predicted RNase H-like nuclease (RuvC/YqgF family)
MSNYNVLDSVNWILAAISTSGLIGWFLGRRRTNAETKGFEIDNEEKEVAADLNNMERLTNRLNELILALDNQMAENIKLKQELHALRVALEHERMLHQELLKKYENKINPIPTDTTSADL